MNEATGPSVRPGARRRVALACVDPLVSAMLARALEDGALEVVALSDPTALTAARKRDVEAVVLDDGPARAGDEPDDDDASDGQPLAALGLPVVALAATSHRARALLAAGARAVLRRDGDGPRLLTALAAVLAGMTVVDAPFTGDTLRWPADAAPAPGDAIPDWVEPLTAREMDVLTLLAEGLSNKDIAEQLGISPHTAKFHVNAILDKLDAQTRTEAVVRAARLGVLSL